MRAPVTDAAASVIASELYLALMDAVPLGQVMSWTRKSLLIDHPRAWPTPALFCDEPDLPLFDTQ